MKILAIETSCDDTAISLAEYKSPYSLAKNFKILAETVSSQEKLHAEYGGVFPSLAKREHQKNALPLLIKIAGSLNLKKTKNLANAEKGIKLGKILERNPELSEQLAKFLPKYQKPKIDKIAITIGPGLEPCLWVGVNFARALSFYWDIPLLGVNHIEAHLYSCWLTPKPLPKFPAIGLVVSGGNTQLALIKKIGQYKLIGETRDDAAGECFDKTARILGLGYPGGKEIAKWAAKFKKPAYNIHLPRPMLHDKSFDFSFSGLKTAVLYDFKKRDNKTKSSENYISEMAKEIQDSVTEVLTAKTIKAAENYEVKSIILGGGVSANAKLRLIMENECHKRGLACFLPDPQYTADNASMIALCAALSPKAKNYNWKNIKPRPNLKING
ncbi:MAG: tRNA (adenosine(37)-N6)-threonylcarbamoyltransferase complex transferase subunit TsaD [Candidatus Pacebacteria bacterium]|nr:tRNA (adenosine(37)-N6)-threonylcarbamoyltransferase complex transferase subunit TsaD [Candidatus Paceibacterota bacterium]